MPANYAGAWRVSYLNEECISRHCYGMLGLESHVDLRLTQMGDRVAGVVPGSAGYTDVAGTVTPDGRLALTGRSTPSGSGARGLVVDRLELQLDAATGLRGYLRMLTEYGGEASAYNGGSGGSITRGRSAPLNSTFAGTWQGYYDTVSCAPGPNCLLDRIGEFEVVLDQSGARLTGVVTVRGSTTASVSGTTYGNQAHLSGDGGGFEVRDFQMQRDTPGRMSGTLTLHVRGSTVELALVRVGRLNDEL